MTIEEQIKDFLGNEDGLDVAIALLIDASKEIRKLRSRHNESLLRVAGNIASGLVTLQTEDTDWVSSTAVKLAREILQKINEDVS